VHLNVDNLFALHCSMKQVLSLAVAERLRIENPVTVGSFG